LAARDAEASADASSGVTSPAAPIPLQVPPQQTASTEIYIAGVRLVADCEGALYWPDERVLIVADLHLEKGSSYAARGVLLPPYDTAATLARLAELIARYSPQAVIALGDSFHDGDGPVRLRDVDRAALVALQRGRDWLWVAGNHDPDPSDHIAGSFAATLAIGPLLFRHAPQAGVVTGEVAGHLHPVARVSGRGRTVRRRCFVSDRKRVILPAFGAYAGGLNVRDRAFAEIFGSLTFTAHMLGKARVYAFAATHCLAD
jgi:DNA ligase-associated metallophosphoesterase